MAAGDDAGGPSAPGGPVRRPQITVAPSEHVAVCCSGGGIRSATFNLGVLQALQESGLYAGVRTVTAVSGGAYIAAAHALAAANLAGDGPAAYAPRTPEESHLRDHTRYLLETWQVAARALATLIRGVLVNALLVGSVVFIVAHLAGWFLGVAGLLSGLRSASPATDLGRWWLIPALAAVATLGLAWLNALPGRRTEARGTEARGTEPRSTDPHSTEPRGAEPRHPLRWLPGWLRREYPAKPSNRALALTLGTTFLLVAAPLAIRGLYQVSLGSSPWSVITRFLGFSNAAGCRAAATAAIHTAHAAPHAGPSPESAAPVCGAPPAHRPAVESNGASGSPIGVKLATFASFAAAIVTLARTTLGRLRTYEAELSRTGPLARGLARAAEFLQRRLVPWIGSALVVGAITALTLRWMSDGVIHPLLVGGWRSPAAECLYAAALFPLLKAVIDINSTSMHGFYRDRLAVAYGVVRRDGLAVPDAGALLSSLDRPGQPVLVICAAANCTKNGYVPPGRGAVSFTFTPRETGLSQEQCARDARAEPGTGRASTGPYEEAARLTLFDIMAVSGAAVSPVMGKMTRPSMRILLAAADVRLGVWLPNPDHVRTGRWRPGLSRLRQPDLKHLWAEAVGSLHLDGKWLYVTDGGHYENLGLVEALRRRPDHLVVIDAAGDGGGWSTTLGQAVSLARSELGVQIDIDPTDLRPGPVTHRCAAPYVAGSFRYPDESAGRSHQLLYLKLAVPDGAPWDVLSYQDIHPAFPTDSTLQQLYDDQEFEAYRALGYHCASQLLQDINLAGP
jgi:hypothetical protein